jgi:glucose/arabinose dehydrogenase
LIGTFVHSFQFFNHPHMLTRTIFILSSFFLLTCCHRDMKKQGGLTAGTPNPLFTKNCSNCHGANAETFIQREWKHGNSRLELMRSIREGYPNEAAHAFGATLKDNQILELAMYIVTTMEQQKAVAIAAATPKANKFVTKDLTFHLDTIVADQEAPWGMAFLPGGDLVFTERPGTLWRVDAKRHKTAITGAPQVLDEGQGGLLDIAVHPKFAENHFIYLTYSKFRDSADVRLSTTAVYRARLDNDQLKDGHDIFVALPYATTRHHYGSRMAFDWDGYLFVTVGERGNQDGMPQFLDKGCGKVHRIFDDGRIPPDNPFVSTPGAVGSIWSYGHRNPQGLTVNPFSGEIWETEHGPRGGDELNWIQKGKNYGWPVVSYGTHYDGRSFTDNTQKAGIENPLTYWVPSIAPSGMAFINSDRYKGWKGDLLVGSLRFKYLTKVHLDGKKVISQEPLLQDLGRMRCVVLGPDGYIYVAIEGPGYVFRLVPE